MLMLDWQIVQLYYAQSLNLIVLSNANTHDTRKMWTLIKSSDVWYKNCTSEFRVNCASSNEINEHFANIVTDPLYVKELVTSQVSDCSLETEDFTEFSEEYKIITALLSKISRTSPGRDNIPFWFFEYFALQILLFLLKLLTFLWKMDLYLNPESMLLLLLFWSVLLLVKLVISDVYLSLLYYVVLLKRLLLELM